MKIASQSQRITITKSIIMSSKLWTSPKPSTSSSPTVKADKITAFVPTYRKDTYSLINPTNFNLTNHHVLITGASKGIGRATALAYGSAGASAIVLAARSDLDQVEKDVLAAAQKAGKKAPRVLKLKLDVTKREDVESVAKLVKSELEYLDVIVNNAGFLEKAVPIIDSDPDIWYAPHQTLYYCHDENSSGLTNHPV